MAFSLNTTSTHITNITNYRISSTITYEWKESTNECEDHKRSTRVVLALYECMRYRIQKTHPSGAACILFDSRPRHFMSVQGSKGAPCSPVRHSTVTPRHIQRQVPKQGLTPTAREASRARSRTTSTPEYTLIALHTSAWGYWH
jgi:hypothetical protein